MFTLKFYSVDQETGAEVCDVVEAPHYQTSKRSGFTLVVTYADATNTNGVERLVGNERNGYAGCFIENSAGKTIDHLRAE